MAEAALSDGQRLLAFNDLFVGVRSHVLARYHIEHGERGEDQSSCGILIATGAGSTGWLRSVYAGAAGVMQGVGEDVAAPRDSGRFAWDAEKLVYVVREPWPSKTTGASMVHGVTTKDRPLVVTSQMAENGVIFSDGIETDYFAFTAGLAVTIGLLKKKPTWSCRGDVDALCGANCGRVDAWRVAGVVPILGPRVRCES
jgi:hypothetical protein